jgi:hypothetical protein
MTNGPPSREFGKRRPAEPQPPSPPVKRSGHVALLLMGTFAIGSGAYALMPREDCKPPSPGMAASPLPQADATCPPRSSSGGSHSSSWSHWSRTNFFSSDSSSGHSSSGGSSDSGAGGVTRGGFGSFARAFSGHFSSGS